MEIVGNEEHFFPFETAVVWNKNYRDARIAAGGDYVKAFAFGKDAINALFDQDGCSGFRAYLALDDDGKQQLIIVGIKKNMDDIVEPGLVVERSFKCPPDCGSTNKLNSDPPL